MRQVTFTALLMLLAEADGLQTPMYPLFSNKPLQSTSSVTALHGRFQTECSKTSQDQEECDIKFEMTPLLVSQTKEELEKFWMNAYQNDATRSLTPSIASIAVVNTKKVKKNTPSRTTLSNIASVLAMNSGFLNGVGLSGAMGRAAGVSAVTGTYTQSALALSRAGPASMLKVLAVPFCYMLGSALNALINPDGIDKNMGALSLVQTSPLLFAGSLVLAANAAGGPFASLACLTIAMGMQNSWTSMVLPGNLLRTAHYSGITSDAGTVLGQALRGNKENLFKLPIYMKLAAGFWTGGLISVFGTQHFGIPASGCLKASAFLYVGLWAMFSTFPKLSLSSHAGSQVRLAHKTVYGS